MNRLSLKVIAASVILVASLRIWPQFSDAVCPARAGGVRRCLDAPFMSVVVALRCEARWLLVVRRLPKPAVLPGARGVIVARRLALAVPWFV